MSVGALVLAAFGLFLAIEGLAYAGAPEMMKRMARAISDMPVAELQRAGWIAAALGAGLVYVALRLS